MQHLVTLFDITQADLRQIMATASSRPSSATADPRPSIDEVQQRLNALEDQAEAAAEVAAAKAAAMAELRQSVAGIAVGAASTVVQKPLDETAQLAIIEDYVNRAGSTN